MEAFARDSSDEEPSLPSFQLNAVTEALLADLDPTSTAPQDSRGIYKRCRYEDKSEGSEAREGHPSAAAAPWRGKATQVDATVGGDSVALGPKFESLQRPPRRPRRNASSGAEELISESPVEGGAAVDESAVAENDEYGRDAAQAAMPIQVHTEDGEPVQQRIYERPKQKSPEKPMRTVVIPARRRETPPKDISHDKSRVPSDAIPPLEKIRHRRIVVNGTSYRILRKLGRGGSGRVYEVMAPDTKRWAFKAIPLANLDERAQSQIKNEVALLQDLRRADRVAYLNDWCVDATKNAIHIVMELGQIDLENIIKDHMEREEKLDPVFVGYYWREMLRCIALIHSLDVVHSDIKPANFVSINGVLKIVDFGIAHGLPDDTINVYIDNLAGTPNYMAPETLKVLSRGSVPSKAATEPVSSRLVRFGKPSDMWSLGCVLHLMVYGRQLFAHIRGLAPKLLAIADPSYEIELESHGLGAVRVPEPILRTMQACLVRDPAARPTAAGLLAGSADAMVPARSKEEERMGRVVGDILADAAQAPVSRQDLERWVEEAITEARLMWM